MSGVPMAGSGKLQAKITVRNDRRMPVPWRALLEYTLGARCRPCAARRWQAAPERPMLRCSESAVQVRVRRYDRGVAAVIPLALGAAWWFGVARGDAAATRELLAGYCTDCHNPTDFTAELVIDATT